MTEQKAFPHSAGNPQVCLSCFPGSVHDTSHNRHLGSEIRILLHHALHLIGQTDQIDLRSPAGRTADQGDPLFSEPQCPKDQLCGPHLLHRIPGQGYPDGISDPRTQDHSQAHR